MIEPIMTTEYKVMTTQEIIVLAGLCSTANNLEVYYNKLGKDGWELKTVFETESHRVMEQFHVFEQCAFKDEPKEPVDKQT